MSSQRGNTTRKRAQKHKNKTAFKNDLHDTSVKTKMINSLEVVGCCARCKDILEWKIKYKKYKPLSGPRKCAKCGEKRVKRAYYLLCDICAQETHSCGKCGQDKDIVDEIGPTPEEEAKQKVMFQYEVSQLSERQRRAFYRLQDGGGKVQDDNGSSSVEDTDDETAGNDDDQPQHNEDEGDLIESQEVLDSDVKTDIKVSTVTDEDLHEAALTLLSLNTSCSLEEHLDTKKIQSEKHMTLI